MTTDPRTLRERVEALADEYQRRTTAGRHDASNSDVVTDLRAVLATPDSPRSGVLSDSPSLESGRPAESGAVEELTEAIRFTVEYVGTEMLPPIPGWSWYDALVMYAPEKAAALAAMPARSAESGEAPKVEVEWCEQHQTHHPVDPKAHDCICDPPEWCHPDCPQNDDQTCCALPDGGCSGCSNCPKHCVCPEAVPFNPDAPQGHDGNGGGYRPPARSAESAPSGELICADRQEHGSHEWIGFPPDVWQCPGRVTLTSDEVALLGESFGGSEPSSLLTSRVERILADRLAAQVPARDDPATAWDACVDLICSPTESGTANNLRFKRANPYRGDQS